MADKSVLIVGLLPELVDLAPYPGLTPEKVRGSIASQTATLKTLGYEAESILLDLGATAETVLRAKLGERKLSCVCIGAGIRVSPPHFLLFEKLLNVVHEQAPGAKICFNTKPDDTIEAIQRWI